MNVGSMFNNRSVEKLWTCWQGERWTSVVYKKYNKKVKDAKCLAAKRSAINSGGQEKRGDVGILVREDLMEVLIQVKIINSQIMKIKIVIWKKVGNVFSVYAPQVGRPEAEKWLESEVLLVAGDLNGHIGEDRRGFEEVIVAHRFGVRNQEGKRMLELCQSKELRVINTMFKRDREKNYNTRVEEQKHKMILYCWGSQGEYD